MKPMTLEEVHDVLYDILVDIHEFCVDNNIKYSLAGGTLLGAIRHNGFIPWDDDIDIQLSRPEYEKFIHSYKSKKGYQLFSREIEGNEDLSIAFTRICEMEKTYVDTGELPWRNNPTGLWIDVVPIDGAPSNRLLARIRIFIMYITWRIMLLIRHANNNEIKNVSSFTKKMKLFVKKGIVKILPKDMVLRYIFMCQRYNFVDSKYLANYSTMQNKFREWQPQSTMLKFSLHKFENGEFWIMEDYNTSLTSLYGDYMKLPPKEKQVAHIENSYFWK